jgi:hypothetical protein
LSSPPMIPALMDQFDQARRLVLGEGRLHIYD